MRAERHTDFLELIVRLAKEFINVPAKLAAARIQDALKEVGQYTQADRVYIFTYHFDRNLCYYAYEWCAPCISEEINNIQYISLDGFHEWLEAHQRGEPFYVPSVASLPTNSLPFQILDSQGIQSTLAVPMTSKSGECTGFIGFDAVRSEYYWEQKDISLLMILGEIITNVQERVELEEERQQVENTIRQLNTFLEERVAFRTSQLEAVNEELNAFSYSVSHDLRSPLRNIHQHVQLLQKVMTDQLPADAGAILNTISNQVVELEKLIISLLDFSRLGQHDITRQEVDMDKLVQSILEKFKSNIDERNIQLELLPLQPAKADPTLLGQVWFNLIDNALKFTKHSESPSLIIGSYRRTGEVVFYLRDNGVGFDDRFQKQLFTVFRRMHQQSEFEGTGIGLATVRRIINKHGGQVWARSQPGSGAAFFFSLPDL
jgi:signal transduction histidine kinase